MSIPDQGARADVERQMGFVDGAFKPGDEDINDEVLRELRHQAVAGTITANEAIERGMAYINGH